MTTRTRIMLSMSSDEIEGIDKARGTLARATWCRQVIAEHLAFQDFYKDWQPKWEPAHVRRDYTPLPQEPPQNRSTAEKVSGHGSELKTDSGGADGVAIGTVEDVHDQIRGGRR